MILSAIAAMAENRVIGKNNRLPWNIPEDLKYFKECTLGKKIIMGRKTFESMGRALPKRENIVLTRQADFKPEGVRVYSDLKSAIAYCQDSSKSEEEVFIIGGSEIYLQSLPLLNRIYLTLIHRNFEGDAKFPEVNLKSDFKVTSERRVSGDPDFTFLVAERK